MNYIKIIETLQNDQNKIIRLPIEKNILGIKNYYYKYFNRWVW